MAEALVISSSLLYAVGIASLRRGLVKSNFVSASVTTMIVETIVISVVLLPLLPKTLNLYATMIFLFTGVFSLGVVRLLYFKGMERLGASTNASIFAVYPLIGSFTAVLLLGEKLTPNLLLGTVITVVGAFLVERGSAVYQGSSLRKPSKTAFTYPFTCAVLVGTAWVFRKIALNIYGEPLVGIAIEHLSSLLLYAVLSAVSRDFHRLSSVNRESFKLFWKGGICIIWGFILRFYAVRIGKVAVVVPLMNTSPLFLLFFAHFFLKRLERVTPSLVAGTISVFTGIVLITAF